MTAGAIGGVVFDYYGPNDFKFVALDVANQRVMIGHWSPRQGYVVDTAISKALALNTNYTLLVSLKGASVAVTLNGCLHHDLGLQRGGGGRQGRTLFTRNGTTSFDSIRLRTNDPAFAPPSERADTQRFDRAAQGDR